MAEYPELVGRTVLVTGAARGIGRGVALGFGAAGCIVVANDLELADAEATADEILSQGGEALAIAADVGDAEAAEAMVERVLTECGELDVLVSNAAINPTVSFLGLSVSQWERTQRTNCWGLLHCGQPAARHMVARGAGSIVVIGSPACNEAYESQTAYAAAKAGLQMLAWSMAWELGRFGVRTNLVHPGWIETELNREFLWSGEDIRARVLRQIPAGRTGQPEDVAAAVLWLCSDAAGYVNGASLSVDGGLVVGRVKA